jgi:hypothetical protein
MVSLPILLRAGPAHVDAAEALTGPSLECWGRSGEDVEAEADDYTEKGSVDLHVWWLCLFSTQKGSRHACGL